MALAYTLGVFLFVFYSTHAAPNAAQVNSIRKQLMYPYTEKDWERKINYSNPQVFEEFEFRIPFYGGLYNYSLIHLDGYIRFGIKEVSTTFPVKAMDPYWPDKADPAFIAAFFKKNDFLRDSSNKNLAGVYTNFSKPEPGGLNESILEAIKLDIQEGMIGAIDFIPKHYLIVTWRNMSGNPKCGPNMTNTYQMVLATDEKITYVIFNYEQINCDFPGFIGFNGGNGTGMFEYRPYSQSTQYFKKLGSEGYINGFRGRHVFRVDEKIERGACNPNIYDIYSTDLTVSPNSGSMYGGTLFNVTGPCINITEKVIMDSSTVKCIKLRPFVATCVSLPFYSFRISNLWVKTGGFGMNFQTSFFHDNPFIAPVQIENLTDIVGKGERYMKITWDKAKFLNAKNVSVKILGLRETLYSFHKTDFLDVNISNTGSYILDLKQLENITDPIALNSTLGLIRIKGTIADSEGRTISPFLVSQPFLLGWYLKKQRAFHFGEDWPSKFCRRWDLDDRDYGSLNPDGCPCTIQQAKDEVGRFYPDPMCDEDSNTFCYVEPSFRHCVISQNNMNGSGLHCCYGKNGRLINDTYLTVGRAFRNPTGHWNDTKIPGLSYWSNNLASYFYCCVWQGWSQDCYTYFWRRPIATCKKYSQRNVATVFGDPHFVTFTNQSYTFNGKGEFSLVHVKNRLQDLDIQGRFEQVLTKYDRKNMAATEMTSIVSKENESSIVQVNLRRKDKIWQYHLDVLVDGKTVYFDSDKHRLFKNVSVYIPNSIGNQSKVIISFPSGASVEVVEERGVMAARVYLPKTYKGMTRGLMGNWSDFINRDLLPPSSINMKPSVLTDGFEKIHNNFGIYWMVTATGSLENGIRSLFTNRTFGPDYNDKNFKPNYNPTISLTPPSASEVQEVCGDVYQCRMDYIFTLNKEYAKSTLKFLSDFTAIKKRLN